LFELNKAAGGTAAILFVTGLLNCRIQPALADRRGRNPLPEVINVLLKSSLRPCGFVSVSLLACGYWGTG